MIRDPQTGAEFDELTGAISVPWQHEQRLRTTIGIPLVGFGVEGVAAGRSGEYAYRWHFHDDRHQFVGGFAAVPQTTNRNSSRSPPDEQGYAAHLWEICDLLHQGFFPASYGNTPSDSGPQPSPFRPSGPWTRVSDPGFRAMLVLDKFYQPPATIPALLEEIIRRGSWRTIPSRLVVYPGSAPLTQSTHY